MNAIQLSSHATKTMTSIELVEFINAERLELVNCGAAPKYIELAHRSFMAKVPEVLGEGYAKFLADYQHPQNGQTYPIYKFPKREACLMAMSYSYELQAKVFDRMTELEGHADPLAHLPAEQRALIAVMVDNAAIKREQAQQGESIRAIEQRIDAAEETHLMLTRPAASEAISHIRIRINKQYGLPTRIIDEIMRQSPYAPKPAGMVKNAHEDAQGGSYAVYWIKDINKVFARFVAECKHQTATQATHPLIEGRFKLNGGVV